jgi:hypothetical protein
MTEQVSNILFFKNKKYWTDYTPPIAYAHRHQIKTLHERIIKLENDEARLNTDNYSTVFSTACWRRFISHFKIDENNRIYLLKIEGAFKLLGEKPLFVNWANGNIILSHELIKYTIPSCAEVFTFVENRLCLKLENGVVIGHEILDKKPETEYEKNHREYFEFLKEAWEDMTGEETTIEFIKPDTSDMP